MTCARFAIMLKRHPANIKQTNILPANLRASSRTPSPFYRVRNDADDLLIQTLRQEMHAHFHTDDITAYVLHHDYGFTPRECMMWFFIEHDPSKVSEEMWQTLEDSAQNQIEQVAWSLGNEGGDEMRVAAMRIYLFFHFVAFEPKHRAKANTHATAMRELLGEEALHALAQIVHLSWHDLIELGRTD